MRRFFGYLLLATVFCVFALYISVTTRVPYATGAYPNDDAYRYIPMAIRPFTSPNPLAHIPPFTWRILTPLIVHGIPVPALAGFEVTTLVGLGGTVLALPSLLEAFGLPYWSSIAATLSFVFLGPATIFNLNDYARIDALAFFLLTLALYCTLKRHGVLLMVVLALLAFDKEIVIIGGIFALAWSWQHSDRSMIRWSVAGLVMSIGILYLLHTLIPASGPYSLFQQLVTITETSLNNGTALDRIQLAFIGTWGILLSLAAWHIWHSQSIWKNHACWLLLVLSTLQVLVSWDIERVVVYAFPVVIAAASFSVYDLAKRWNISMWAIWLLIYVLEVTWQFTYEPPYFFTIVKWHGVEVAIFGLLTLFALVYPVISSMTSTKKGGNTTPRMGPPDIIAANSPRGLPDPHVTLRQPTPGQS